MVKEIGIPIIFVREWRLTVDAGGPDGVVNL